MARRTPSAADDALPTLPAWRLQAFLDRAPRRCVSGHVSPLGDCFYCGAVMGQACLSLVEQRIAQ